MLLRLDDITRRIGGRTLFANVSLVARAGDRIGLVGPNGAGKSTLLRIASREEPADSGTVQVVGDSVVRRLRQEIDPSRDHTVRSEAGTAFADLSALEAELRELEAEMAGPRSGEVPAALAERYDRVSTEFTQRGGFSREARVEEVLEGLGFDAEARDRPLHSFSGGWLMRLELAKLLLARPDMLLLDEPTNHLDLPAIQWFEETLTTYRGAVVTVSHDRTFLRRHVDRVAELDGRGGFNLYEGNYDYYLLERERRLEELRSRAANLDRERAHMEKFVERFRYKASKARQAQSRLKAIERLEKVEVEPENRSRIRLRIPAPTRSGRAVLRLDEIHKSYGDRSVYTGIDFALERGDRVALVGPNGAGKSTLLRIAGGVLDFDRGERTLGHNVQTAFYAQHQLEVLNPARSVLEELAGAANADDVPRLRSHLGAFLFSGDSVDKRVSVLSGGEKARLALAILLLHPANFLVLDEPTNHLDLQACEVVEQALRQYDGSLLFVSHDRSFINALATRVVEVRGGRLREFLGNYDDYLRDREERPAAPRQEDPGTEERPVERREQRRQDRERRKSLERTRRRLTRVEEEIARFEAEAGALTWRQGDPQVARDAAALQEIETERASLAEKIEGRYRDWERLADELTALEDDREE